jgi:hypothetical protein
LDWPSLCFGFAVLGCAYLVMPGRPRHARKGDWGVRGATLVLFILTGTAIVIPFTLPRVIISCTSDKACKSWVKILILRISDSPDK